MVNILKKLEVYNCPILHIPGNHDCLVQYKSKILTNKSHNIHKQEYQLAQGLKIKGFGGSVPAYSKSKQVWEGYPFTNEEEFQAEFKDINQPQKQQFILMTHNGPSKNTTSRDSAYQQQIESGSSTLLSYIQSCPQNLLLNIHGHTHEGQGVSKHRKITILNPGSVSRGHFGIISLSRRQGRWGVESTQFFDLNYM